MSVVGHFSAVPIAPSNVGYAGWTGRYMLIVRFSHFDRPIADVRFQGVQWSWCTNGPLEIPLTPFIVAGIHELRS